MAVRDEAVFEYISPMWLPLCPSLLIQGPTERPFESLSTRIGVIPLGPREGSFFAYSTITSAQVALEIHIFAPFTTYPPSVFVAVVLNPSRSEPASLSLNAAQPMNSPEHNFGKYFCFCASLALRTIWLMTKLLWTL